MALRVLLADESSTIKKVIQLALHDYGVEVKTVPNGLDVLLFVKSYHPDIIFADVLLSKKSGYDVCADLQKEESTRNIPVILMWSGFMEIDPIRFEQCGAKAKLEKPFDTQSLRALVHEFVPKTISNPISAFLKFPKQPEFLEEKNESPKSIEAHETQPSKGIKGLNELETESKPTVSEDFEQVSLTNPSPSSKETWSSENLAQFRIQVAPETQHEKRFVIPDEEIVNIEVEDYGEFEEVQFSTPSIEPTTSLKKSDAIKENFKPDPQNKTHPQTLSEEKLLLEARSIIESICWKILPDIAGKIVREEIQKLIKETEKDF